VPPATVVPPAYELVPVSTRVPTYDGWGRLNLYAAFDGYGAFTRAVTVTMDTAQGGPEMSLRQVSKAGVPPWAVSIVTVTARVKAP
jgi:hypothetical protein